MAVHQTEKQGGVRVCEGELFLQFECILFYPSGWLGGTQKAYLCTVRLTVWSPQRQIIERQTEMYCLDGEIMFVCTKANTAISVHISIDSSDGVKGSIR